MGTCPTAAIKAVLNLTHLHILVECTAKMTTRRMIEEELAPHEVEETWDMPRNDLPADFDLL